MDCPRCGRDLIQKSSTFSCVKCGLSVGIDNGKSDDQSVHIEKVVDPDGQISTTDFSYGTSLEK